MYLCFLLSADSLLSYSKYTYTYTYTFTFTHHTVLGITRDADETVVKKAHRKLARQFHPDKNYGNEEAAKEFRFVQQAYECLTDPAERKYYDEHRESILKGVKPGEGMDGDTVDFLYDITPFHFTGCYDGYGDGENGFFGVYRQVFFEILEGEIRGWVSEGNIDENDMSNAHLPRDFGTGSWDWKDVSQFYNSWESFSSCLSFAWADKYDPREAESRFVRRRVDDENKKARRVAKRERNDDVMHFVAFVKKRDPRVIEARERAEEEKVLKEKAVKEAAAKRKVDAAAAREAWMEEREAEMLEMEKTDLNAGRVRLADLNDSDDDYYGGGRKGRKGKKGRKKKGKKNKPQWSSDEEEVEVENDKEEVEVDVAAENDEETNSNKEEGNDNAAENVTEEKTKDDNDVEEKSEEAGVGVLDILEHLDLHEEQGELSDSSYEEEEDLEPKVWKCEFCKKTFKSEAQFDNHLNSKKHKELFKKFQSKNK